MPLPCKNKQDYVGGTNDKTRESDDAPSDTDSCARNLDNEHKNEEDNKYIEPPSEENDRIQSKISEGIIKKDVINSLLAKISPCRLIKAVLFTIENHEKDISEVGYQNKTIQTKDKWNHLNLMHIKSLLGSNHCMPLSHMAKSYIWIEETNECINKYLN